MYPTKKSKSRVTEGSTQYSVPETFHINNCTHFAPYVEDFCLIGFIFVFVVC